MPFFCISGISQPTESDGKYPFVHYSPKDGIISNTAGINDSPALIRALYHADYIFDTDPLMANMLVLENPNYIRKDAKKRLPKVFRQFKNSPPIPIHIPCIINNVHSFPETSIFAHIRRLIMKANEIADLLYDFFIQNCSLSLPGIGTFDMFRISAQTDFANKRIIPPTFSISYNNNQDAPNKELFDYVSKKTNLSEWEAIKIVNDFASDLKNVIKNGEQVAWEGIGLLKSGLSGDIVFEPHRLSYEFIPQVGARRVIRKEENHQMMVGDRQLTKEEMQHLLATETTEVRVKESWWIYAFIIVAVAIVLIAIRLFTSDTGLTTSRHENIRAQDSPSTYSNLR